METNQSSIKPKCSVHQDEEAKAVCLEKKELLCFPCALDRARLDNIQEIDKISEGNEKLLVEYLVLNQIASKNKTNFVEYERKVGKVKQKLEHEVNTFYNQLAEKIKDLKESSLHSIGTQAETFLKEYNRGKNEFEEIQKVMKGNIEKLLVSQSSDIESFKSELEKVRTKITDNMFEFDSKTDGNFIVHKHLQDVTYKTQDGLGKVNIFKVDHYSLPSQEASDIDEPYITPTTNTENANSLRRPQIPPKPVIASGSMIEKPKPRPRSTRKHIPVPLSEDDKQSNETKSTDGTLSSNNDPGSTPKSKKEKPRKPLFGGLFSSKEKRKPEEREELYVDVDFYYREKIQAKHLINTTTSVSGLESPIKAPFQFSKIVAIGDDKVGLLSSSHSLIAVTRLDGTALCSKTYQTPVTSIVAMGKDQLAILSLNEGAKIHIVDVSGSQFEENDIMEISFELSDITGFDYSKTKSHFAIGTRTKHLIIDIKRKKIKSTDIGNVAGSSDIATTYDFVKDRYFILNMEQKKLKCVVLKSMECIWKCKCGDQQFQPKAICLYKDQLCVTSSQTVMVFSAIDGKPERKHDTSALLDSCLGICVINDVLVISSDSDNFQQSKNICFIGL